MKYIFVNLKRFDVPPDKGGVNRIFQGKQWGEGIIKAVNAELATYDNACFALFFPEAHLIPAQNALVAGGNISIGSQSVHFDNISPGGNFGAFTTSLPGAAAAAIGCSWTIIGHCEERNKLKAILSEGNCGDLSAVNRILAKQVKCALDSGLKVLYCVGENESEQPTKEEVLKQQLSALPKNADIVVAYEPVWAIGPGKTPPEAAYIREISQYIKTLVDYPVVYGGGLKSENARMLAEIESIDGGLIALTRFSGEIGFYPEEYLEIVKKYLKGEM